MRAKFTVRNCDPEDSRDRAAYERLKEGAVFAHLLTHPGYRVEENLFFAEEGGLIVGYVNVLPELGIGRVILEYGVSPSHGLEEELEGLFEPALKRAKELGAKVAHVNIPATNLAQGEVLSGLGFRQVRRFYELRLDVSKINIASIDKPKAAFRSLRPGEEVKLAQMQNRCFVGTWSYNPNRAEDIAWRLKVKGNCLEDVVLAMDRGEAIGYCWTETECGCDSPSGKIKGRVYMIGVEAHYRNKGIGKEVLKAGLLLLKNKGREVVDITVDSQNVAAVALYRSLGFQTWSETMWYEKVID